MRKIRIAALLAALFAGLIAMLLLSLRREHGAGVTCLSLAAFESETAGKTESVNLLGVSDRLLIDGANAPYDAASKTYFVPVGLDAEARLPALSWSNGNQTAVLGCGADKALTAAVETAEEIQLAVFQGNAYERRSVVLTGLAAVVIDMESDTETFGPYSEAIASVCVFDPAGESGFTTVRAQAKLTYRGASSRFFNKKSYNLSLYGENGEQSGYPLLGMRQDDKWILKSMFTDPNRMREKLALSLWNELAAENKANVPSAEMEYCEVFLDDGYLGLYGLMTPIDPLDCGFDSARDVLFKAASFDILTEDASAYPKRALKDNGIKFPDVWRENLWEGILWYVDLFYKENPADGFESATAHLNLENFVDYALFHSFVSARDNNFSNTFYLTRYTDDGGYEIHKFPWDLDMTFGNVWSGGWPDMSEFSERTLGEVSFPHDMNVLLENYTDVMTPLVQERYFALRKTVLDPDHALSLAKALLFELQSSGALAREQARWPEMHIPSDIADLERYFPAHSSCLDARIASGERLYED